MTLSKLEILEIEKKIKEKDIYTTKEAAKCLNVFTNTVINWVEKGHLKCYRTPGGHRKIPKEELLNFVRNHGFHRNIAASRKPRVLIIEDDEDAKNLCANILGCRYEIKSVENGFYAGIVKEYKPDVIILDIMLPDIDGEQVCQFIRSDDTLKNIKIIAVSAISDERKIDSLYRSGINDFLGKPYEINQLEQRVESLLTNVA